MAKTFIFFLAFCLFASVLLAARISFRSADKSGFSDIEKVPAVNASAPADQSCADAINAYRYNLGLNPLTANTNQDGCVGWEAQNDADNGWHNSFGKCGEWGQCECAGVGDIASCIAMYYAEGPGGGHYDIITSTSYTSVACGNCNCGSYGTFWTQSFFP